MVTYWIEKARESTSKEKTRVEPQRRSDCNLTIFPAIPAANLMPGLLLCFPLNNIRKVKKGILSLGQPRISIEMPRHCAIESEKHATSGEEKYQKSHGHSGTTQYNFQM